MLTDQKALTQGAKSAAVAADLVVSPQHRPQGTERDHNCCEGLKWTRPHCLPRQQQQLSFIDNVAIIVEGKKQKRRLRRCRELPPPPPQVRTLVVTTGATLVETLHKERHSHILSEFVLPSPKSLSVCAYVIGRPLVSECDAMAISE